MRRDRRNDGTFSLQVTERYPASLEMDKTWEINEGLF